MRIVRRGPALLALLGAGMLCAADAAPAGAAGLRLKRGWPVGGVTRVREPVLADLDRDGSAEIVAVGYRTAQPEKIVVFVLDGRGAARKGWPQESGLATTHPPLVGDVTGDGEAEIVAYDGKAVSLWTRGGKPIGRLARPVPGLAGQMHSDAGAALGDVDGDGALELVYGTWKGELAAVRLRTIPEQVKGFPVAIGGSIGCSPALADLDGDGRDEIVIANETTGLYIVDLGDAGPAVTRAVGADGAPLLLKARSSPSVADLDGDGRPTILIGSYLGNVYAFDGRGALRWSYRTDGNVHATPAPADLDGDGRLEVSFTSYDGRAYRIGPDGKRSASRPEIWFNRLGTILVAGDTTGDGLAEVLITTSGSIIALGSPAAVWTDTVGPGIPLLGDVDGDGLTDLVFSGADEILVFALQGGAAEGLPWPSNRHDARRSGSAFPGKPPATR